MKENFEGIPHGVTKLVINELKKAVETKENALTEPIDDAIEAVNDSPTAIIDIKYDKDLHKLSVSDFGYGHGMSGEICEQIINDFYSHHFNNINGLMSRFGLGRFYAFAMLGNHPNMKYKTSIGNGVMYTVSCEVTDIENDGWERHSEPTPCEKGIHGTEVTYEDVYLSDEEVESMKRLYSIHYAMAKCTIRFNGVELEKYNPCYIEELPDGIDTNDGLYVKNGLVHYVKSYVCNNGKHITKFKTFNLHITKRGVDYIHEKTGRKKDDITSALNGGFYGCVGSNIVNKGNNGKEFFDLVLTRGGCGNSRLFMKVYQDEANIFNLNDVKALGYDSFISHKWELDDFKTDDGRSLFSGCISEDYKNCRKLYNIIGQEKHTYDDDEIFKLAQGVYNPPHPKIATSKIRSVARKVVKDVHVKYIEKMYDYVTPKPLNKGILNITIPQNKENVICVDVNKRELPSNWEALTKEDILIGIGHFFINELDSPEMLNKFNNNFKNYICHYENQ